MKSSFFAFILIMLQVTILGQSEKPITKGNIQWGGNIGISYNSSKTTASYMSGTYKEFYFTIAPSLGYFFIDNLVVGIQPSFGYNYTSEPYKETIYSIGIGPYLKYYHSSGFMLSLEGGYQSRFGSEIIQNLSDMTYKYTVKSFNCAPGAGYAFFINNKISIELILKYQFYYSADVEDNSGTSTFRHTKINGLDFGTGISLFF